MDALKQFASIPELMALGLEHHHARRFHTAEKYYRQILELNSYHADAWHLLGFVQYQQGRLEPAREHIYRAIQLQENRAAFHHNLGDVYRALEKFPEAMLCYRRALQLQPNLVESHNNLGLTLQKMNRLNEAVQCYRAALELQPDDIDVHYNLAILMKVQGRINDAITHYRRVLTQNPDYCDARHRLVQVYRDHGLMEEAEQLSRRCLDRRPDDAEMHMTLAKVLLSKGQGGATVLALQRAAELNPQSVELHHTWGTCLVQLGKIEEALAHFHEALKLDPKYVKTYSSLGELCIDKSYELSEEELSQVKELIKDETLPLLNLAALDFVLAYHHERRDEHDDAFVYFLRGNQIKLQNYHERSVAFDTDIHRRFIDDIIKAFPAATCRRLAALGSSSEVPVFIVGMPRSGTTLVNHILSAHPEIRAPGELLKIPLIHADLASMVNSATMTDIVGVLDRNLVLDLANQYLRYLTWFDASARRVTDKLPGNFLYLGLITTLFPKARIIHCQRDPMDSCLSIFTRNFNNLNFSATLETVGFYYREYERLMNHWRTALPTPMYEVRYEDLVVRTEEITREMIAFCGVDWNDNCLTFHKSTRPVLTASRVQVRQPVYKRSVKRWAKYARHLGPLIEALGLRQSDLGSN